MEEVREDIKHIDIGEWLAQAEKLFGKDTKHWKFVCPNCGHIQTAQDLIDLNIEGLDPSNVYFNCIGRYDRSIPQEKIGTLGDGVSPCDYTLGGLFRFVKTLVVKDGKEFPVFEFARSFRDQCGRTTSARVMKGGE